MAKFSSYHTLCPGIDPQNLLGVERDADSGCAIVTLGRNMVYRYKLQDLKEASCWSSQEWLTTQVVYDRKTSHYVAVLNEKYLRLWEKPEKHLHKVKKYKFDVPFRALVVPSSEQDSPVLVRRDGATASLPWALENRKAWSSKIPPNPSNEELWDCRLLRINSKTYFCALCSPKPPAEHSNFLVREVNAETYVGNRDNDVRIELKRPSEELVGHVILQNQNNAYLLTLWSHGRLYSYPLTGACSEPVPGILVSVITSISPKHPAAMTALNESTIAIYGADANEEGAVLIIYNIQFKLVQAIHKLKLYTKGAKLWQMDHKLLLAANQHLAVVSYRLASQRIETMLGSSLRFQRDHHQSDDCDVMEIRESTIADWQESVKLPEKIPIVGVPKNIAKQITVYVNEGASDATIQRELIPQLIEGKDVRTIVWCLDNFKDLPEKLLIDLLAFGIRTPEETFVPLQNGSSGKQGSVITRHQFLDRIFSVSFSDICLLPHLKASLMFDEVLSLMEYFIEKLGCEGGGQGGVEANDKQLYEWCSLIMDSHYQHYLLSKDPEVLRMFGRLSDILDDHFQVLKEMEELRPMVQRIINGKPLKISSRGFNKFYSIEAIQLY
ncbi:uncharacterized protein LOC107038255 [Diachasma alloeum]|uniref:uncharacterized protein LOC107038255 n=1 Tax=Diachasma alloeum TaxID=454923 RepID=UPI0007384E9A|nr:uncharacterized protein LOC107038255 [Diachasma alloeum]